MASCPACGTEAPADALECPRCQLSVALFDAVREAVGVDESDPRFTSEVQELLQAVDSRSVAEPPDTEAAGPGVLAYPSRFPSPATPVPAIPPGAPRTAPVEAPAPPSLNGLPSLPALPSGGAAGMRRQIEEYERIARAFGLDLSDVPERNKAGLSVDDPATLERVGRELFVRLAAVLAEGYEEVVGLRNGLATLVPTASEDAELAEARAALLAGDLAGAEGRISAVRTRLRAIEEEHETQQILIAECELLADTTRELGGDPGPAMGPVEEGRRLVRAGKRAEAEAVLARAAVALWSVLYPRLAPELARIKEAMVAQRARGVDIAPQLRQLRDLAGNLKHRNFAAAIAAYRRLRELAGPMPEGSAAGAANATPAPSP